MVVFNSPPGRGREGLLKSRKVPTLHGRIASGMMVGSLERSPAMTSSSPTFPLRLTQAQRRAVAGLLSTLRPRLLLDEANQRTLQFTLDEMGVVSLVRGFS